jgi:cytochrome oxidase Cu insertion factor (SCO1/SenC/PrrC family)
MNLHKGSANLIPKQMRIPKGVLMRWSKSFILFIFFAASVTLATEANSPKATPAHVSLQAATPGHASSILKVGDRMPTFRAVDQFGTERDFANLKGPNGLVILFFRSADW